MRITDYEKEYSNILWFATDIGGNVIFAQSLESDVPEFVCRNKEKSERLAELLCDGNDGNISEYLCSKGLYHYIADDPYESVYRRVQIPANPVKAESLTKEIKDLMSENVLMINAETCLSFEVVGPLVHNITEE